MTRQLCIRSIVGLAFITAAYISDGPRASAQAPLALGSARVTIAGTSNVHAYTASTTRSRVTRAQLAPSVAGANFWENASSQALRGLRDRDPGGEVGVTPRRASTRTCTRRSRSSSTPTSRSGCARFEAGGAGRRSEARSGCCKIAGVEREVALDLKTQRKETTLTVKGEIRLLMTDYGITPPKAMLGMLKTDPKVTVTFETVLAVPLT